MARALTCRELTGFLADYFAGALSAEARRRFDRHVAECAECAAYLRGYVETIRLAKDAYAEAPVSDDVPEKLVQAVLAAVRRRPRRRPATGRRRHR